MLATTQSLIIDSNNRLKERLAIIREPRQAIQQCAPKLTFSTWRNLTYVFCQINFVATTLPTKHFSRCNLDGLHQIDPSAYTYPYTGLGFVRRALESLK